MVRRGGVSFVLLGLAVVALGCRTAAPETKPNGLSGNPQPMSAPTSGRAIDQPAAPIADSDGDEIREANGRPRDPGHGRCVRLTNKVTLSCDLPFARNDATVTDPAKPCLDQMIKVLTDGRCP
ncbi:MAG TPA: hypothetical protein VGP07_00030, partial [Polyangia bacterium]